MIIKNLIAAVLLTFCITAVLFTIIPVNSTGTYDPWVDTNHDGKINVLDLIKVAASLNSAGDPALNVTIARHATHLFVLANGTTIGARQIFPTSWTSPTVNLDGYTSFNVIIENAANMELDMQFYAGVSGSLLVVNIFNCTTNPYVIMGQQVTLPYVTVVLANYAPYVRPNVWVLLYATA